jgi:shikimate kinase
LPRYYVDPKTGQTIRDFAKVYTNEIPQTNSPAVSPKNKTNSTNSIEREQRELKEKSSPAPSLQAPNYSGFSTYGGLSPSSARLNALTAAKARSKKAYSGLRVARARRKG